MKKLGIIFDLDGTLLNTIKDINEAVNYALSKNGLTPVTVEQTKYLVGSGVSTLVKRALHLFYPDDLYPGELYKNVFDDYMYSYNLWKYNTTAPYEGTIRTLNLLKKWKVKLGVVSNKPHKDTLAVIDKFFPNIFDIVIGQRENVPIKPDPTSVLEVIEKFNLSKEECLYVGDTDIDIKTSQNAGLLGVGACYGFRSKKELLECGCTDTINAPHELLKYFRDEQNGVLLLDKPLGITSQDAVTTVKRILKVEKVGHAGTLDPLSTGLLVVLVGEATKLSNYLLEDDKAYIATILIGKETNTLDGEGEIVREEKVPVNKYLPEEIDELLSKLVGTLYLETPMHSAIKVNGHKLCNMARKGKKIDLPLRETIVLGVNRTTPLEYKNDSLEFSFYIHVKKGAYIRSICQKIGLELNTPTYMTGLRRVSSGKLQVSEANSIEDLKNENYKLISLLEAISSQKVVNIKDTLVKRVSNGMPLKLKDITDDVIFLVNNNKLIAIYEKLLDGSYKARRIWK